VLEYIIGLDTPQKGDQVLVMAGCQTVEDLLYVKTENPLTCLADDTPIVAKTRLKTLKKWTEETYDVNRFVVVADLGQCEITVLVPKTMIYGQG
jgi:hypothetical protein